MNDQERISALEAEVKRLEIKLDTLVAYLNYGYKLGPPDGRELYDMMVMEALKNQGL